PHVTPLRGPAKDVNNIERLIMSSWGYKKGDIHKLVNSRATRKNILYELENWLGRSADEELLFYYSGHGWHQKDRDGDEKDGQDETLAPYDSLPKPSEGVVENMISDDEIAAVVKKLQDRKLTLIFDSCYSGTVSRGISPRPQESNNGVKITKSLDPFSFNPQRTRGLAVKPSQAAREEGGLVQSDGHMIVWSAASSSQQAFTDIETKSGSVFTNRFIKGIQQRKADYNRDGIVTNSEQLMYLQRESEAFCKRNRQACKLGLTPMLEVENDLLGSSVIPEKKSRVSSLQAGIDSMLPGERSAQVTVRVREGHRLRLGDPVTIECTSNRSGYLVLLDINAKGEMLQIFPNRYSTPTADNFIPARRAVVIPGPDWGFTIEAQPPLGKNKLIAIFTEDRVNMNDLLGKYKDLEVITEPTTYLADMTGRLQSVWVGDDVNRPVKWSKAIFEYDIVQ
ncbi:MAG: DUF4384 domain-containing protein, partial [Candidatus Electrothrix sp. LOE2]|nr:DUF4384 domain-containing protein [Candidatus Electrothrix sp. LOE2]